MQKSDPARKVHEAIFETYFPSDLPIPPNIRKDIQDKARQVSDALYSSMQGSAELSKLLASLANPTQSLPPPLLHYLKSLHNPAVKAFLRESGGFGALSPFYRSQVFAAFFSSTESPSAKPLAFIAMTLRLVYLSAIWSLDLSVSLTGIQRPEVFVDDTEIYAALHRPEILEPRLVYDPDKHIVRHRDGPIDYLIIGSGPGGSAVAHQLATRGGPDKRGARVVVLERGPFVVWGSMDTRNYPALMFKNNAAATVSNSVIIRSGQAVGGGTTVNVDLAFSPLEATIFSRIQGWITDGRIDGRFYTAKRIAAAYQWVREQIQTRELTQTELNRDNLALWNGAVGLGVDPSLYHLNRFQPDLSPSPVADKRDAARQLLLKAMASCDNPLSVIPDAIVQEITFDRKGPETLASGVKFKVQSPWTERKNTVVDPDRLGIPVGTEVSIQARNIILAAGSLGTTRILLKTAKVAPEVNNPNIGKGPILHPSMPIIGAFEEPINLLRGLDCASFVDAFGVAPGFIFETISGLPDYGAVMTPGNAGQVYDMVSDFNRCAGFGVMLVDTPTPTNGLRLDEQSDEMVVEYDLSESDRNRFRIGVTLAVRMMFLAKARRVVLPSNENLLGKTLFDPTDIPPLTRIEDADLIADTLQFVPNRTLLTSAHLQAANKIGNAPSNSVVSWKQRVWNVVTGREITNLYIMDGSIFPTSVGANPMQSIYTFSKIFSDRLLEGIDESGKPAVSLNTPENRYSGSAPPIAFPSA